MLLLTASVYASTVSGDGGDEDDPAPVLSFHTFDHAFYEEEGCS